MPTRLGDKYNRAGQPRGPAQAVNVDARFSAIEEVEEIEAAKAGLDGNNLLALLLTSNLAPSVELVDQKGTMILTVRSVIPAGLFKFQNGGSRLIMPSGVEQVNVTESLATMPGIRLIVKLDGMLPEAIAQLKSMGALDAEGNVLGRRRVPVQVEGLMDDRLAAPEGFATEPGKTLACGCIDLGEKGVLPCNAHRLEALTGEQEAKDRAERRKSLGLEFLPDRDPSPTPEGGQNPVGVDPGEEPGA